MTLSAVQNYKTTKALRKENDRLIISGVLKQKATAVIIFHNFDHHQREAVTAIIVGVGLLTIAGMFVVLWGNLIIGPIPVLYPVTLLLSSVYVINTVNLTAVVRSINILRSLQNLSVSLNRRKIEINESTSTLPRKQCKLSPTELLLIIHDAGFDGNIHEALGLLDDEINPSMLTESCICTTGIEKNLAVSLHLSVSYKIVDNSETYLLEDEVGKNIMSDDCSLITDLNSVQQKLGVDLCWDITSLVLNCVACLGLFAFPVLTLIPTHSAVFNANCMYMGNLVGNIAWMIEPLLYAVYKSIDTDIA
eukprot:CAMPEP_0114417290 /NCGR_PEP_ID=MMETSP0103-20121206/2883_1 /TAXON_ID=37642 ORGANISM="Paraphysomonas imperforata, Strain PA2" /NCGR_SAMPLE_ID=MMETSP0103 /ASSEMBLY_ACC=CAM_ASM_000201 /LENGTH=305 /DNA_ID=CAMNT_0001585569 /DNA_START=235 /DNA_END=1150 /DNA_ORIENTATION=-